LAVAGRNTSWSPGRRIRLLFGGAGGTGAPLICVGCVAQRKIGIGRSKPEDRNRKIDAIAIFNGI
jgi:hypothetical protein